MTDPAPRSGEWQPPAYPGARHLLRSGRVDVAAVYPPPEGARDWNWRCWYVFATAGVKMGTAKSEEAAKKAAEAAWHEFLDAAELVRSQPSTNVEGSKR